MATAAMKAVTRAALVKAGSPPEGLDGRSPLARMVAEGRMEEALLACPALVESLREGRLEGLADRVGVEADAEAAHLAGVAAYSLFVRANWTGPTPREDLLLPDEEARARAAEAAHAELLLDGPGEDLYEGSDRPWLLAAAVALLRDPRGRPAERCPLWAARTAVVQQRLFPVNLPRLREAATGMYAAAVAQAVAETASSGRSPAAVRAEVRVRLEASRAAQTYWGYALVAEHIAASAALTGLTYELGGAMGKRTRWQADKKAQVVVRAWPALPDMPPEDAEPSEGSANAVASQDLNSDVLLERLALDDEDGAEQGRGPQRALPAVDELTVLAAAHDVQNRNPTGAEMTRFETLAYVRRVVETPGGGRSWAARVRALADRSRLELRDRHTVDRSVLQLEHVVHHSTGLQPHGPAAEVARQDARRRTPAEEEALCADRARDALAAGLEPWWESRGQLADVYVGMGVLSSAVELLRQTRDWDRLVEAYVALGRHAEAEEMLARRPDGESDPLTLCLLGDIRKDPALYERAWEASASTHARAKRSLGKWHLDRGNHAECVAHYRDALAINPLFVAGWFATGHCLAEMGDHEGAVAAFTRAVGVDPDYGHAWNNLAAAHLRLGRHEEALGALEQAVRLSRDNWQVWDNLLSTALKLGRMQQAMTAMERVVELRSSANSGKDAVEGKAAAAVYGAEIADPGVLRHLCVHAIEHAGDGFTADRFRRLLDTVAERAASHPTLWEVRATLEEACGAATAEVVRLRERASRAAEFTGWQHEVPSFEAVVAAVERLVDAYLREPTAARVFSARTRVEAVAFRASKSNSAEVVAHDGRKTLDALLERIGAAKPTTGGVAEPEGDDDDEKDAKSAGPDEEATSAGAAAAEAAAVSDTIAALRGDGGLFSGLR